MSTALIEVSQFQKQFPVLAPGSEQARLIQANLAGDEIGVGDLDRVKVPSGNGPPMWTVNTMEGEKPEKVLEGIILHVARRRAYWKNRNLTSDQPDCSSTDCVTGVGTPGGQCADCPLNRFGTAVRQDGSPGRGKACKETALLFLLRPGANLPEIVVVPPGSLKAVRQYRLKLTVPYFAAITRLELVKTSSRDGIAYYQIKPTFVGQLPPDAANQVRQFAETLSGVFTSVTVSRQDIESDEAE